MKKFSIVCLLLFCLLDVCGQSSREQKAAELMNAQDWFSLRAFLHENGDSLGGFIGPCAEALVRTYFNEPQAAAEGWSGLLERYAEALDPNARFGYGYLLMSVCEDIQDYERGIDLCDELLATERLDSAFVEHIRSVRDRMAGFARFPKLRIVMPGTSASVRMKGGGDEFSCTMEWNGCSLPTLFDTGAQFTVLSKETADRIGVKYLPADTMHATKNGLSLLCAVVDSLCTEGLAVYNVPVYILSDTDEEPAGFRSEDAGAVSRYERARKKAEKKMAHAIVGIPLMKRFAEIGFDREKSRITFSTESTARTRPGSPLCIINNNLYLKYGLNGLDMVGYVDTGMGGKGDLIVYNRYYRQYKDRLPALRPGDTETHRMLVPGGLLELECRGIGPVRMEAGGGGFDLSGVGVLTDESAAMDRIDPYPLSGGFLGFAALSKAAKVTFDFRRMEYRAEYRE